MSGGAHSVLGIIAGGGHLPLQLVENCQATGRPFFVLALEESADIDAIKHVPHAVVRLGAVGDAIAQLHRAEAKELVLAGKVKRPSFMTLRPDAMGAKLMARMGASIFSGDDALLKALVAFLEEEGFSIVGSDDLMGGLLAPAGVLGKIKPDRRAQADITHGMSVAKTLGELDVGQAAIVENGYVLGVEAAEGTDGLIERCVTLKRESIGGVLVKAKKPSQEARVDLPTIGPLTVEKVHAAGLSGIAVEAGGAIILEKEKTLKKADSLGIFIIGIAHE